MESQRQLARYLGRLSSKGSGSKGPEAEAECSAAIAAGTSPEEYRATVATRFILDGMAARGR